jgi:hypothetical protein
MCTTFKWLETGSIAYSCEHEINVHGKKLLTSCRLCSMKLVPLLFLRVLNLKIKRQFCTRALPLVMTTLISQLTEGVNIYTLFLEEYFVLQFSI